MFRELVQTLSEIHDGAETRLSRGSEVSLAERLVLECLEECVQRFGVPARGRLLTGAEADGH